MNHVPKQIMSSSLNRRARQEEARFREKLTAKSRDYTCLLQVPKPLKPKKRKWKR